MRLSIIALAAMVLLAGCSSTPQPGPVNDAACAGGDLDGDLIADSCDDDLNDGPRGDTDRDGVLNEFDRCVGHDDRADADGDGVADGCDTTPIAEGNESDDGNATQPEPVCGVSEGMNDADGDGMGDDCDPDNTDGPAADSDGDGVRNDADICPGHDDANDVDGDGKADGCDLDNNDGPLGDADFDWVLNKDDVCPGFQDGHDLDFDGVADGCDADFQDVPGQDPQALALGHDTNRACIGITQDGTKYRVGVNPLPVVASAFCKQADWAGILWSPWTFHLGGPNMLPCLAVVPDQSAGVLRLGIVEHPALIGLVCHTDEDLGNAVWHESLPMGEQTGMVCINAQQEAQGHRVRIGVGLTSNPNTLCDARAASFLWGPWSPMGP